MFADLCVHNVFSVSGLLTRGSGHLASSSHFWLLLETGLLVAVTTDGVPPGTLNTVVEKLGDYLRSNNY